MQCFVSNSIFKKLDLNHQIKKIQNKQFSPKLVKYISIVIQEVCDEMQFNSKHNLIVIQEVCDETQFNSKHDSIVIQEVCDV